MDDYHGTKVPDPYRWLEDDRSAETEKWVEAQNNSFAYLEKIPNRRQMKDRLEKLYNYPKYSAPFRKGEYFYFSKNTDSRTRVSCLARRESMERRKCFLTRTHFQPMELWRCAVSPCRRTASMQLME